MTRILLLAACLISSSLLHAAQVAIILDDIGYRQSDELSLSLPQPITLSILPHTPLGQRIGLQAQHQQREVMIHMPMESLTEKELGPGTITSEMDRASIIQQLELAHQNLPMAVGMNNHMGSKLTAMRAPMQTTMQWLQEKQLYFVDSRTTAASLAEQTALQHGLQTSRRRVFLDNQLSAESLQKQVTTLIRLAQKHQQAIAIAHPHPETLAMLEHIDEKLAKHGVTLVPVSHLMSDGQPDSTGTQLHSQTGKE